MIDIVGTAIAVWKAGIDRINRWSKEPCPHCGEVIVSSKGLLRSMGEEAYKNLKDIFREGNVDPSVSLAQNGGINAEMQDNQLVCSNCGNPVSFNTHYEPEKA